MQIADIRILAPEDQINLTTRVGDRGAILTFAGPDKQAVLSVSLAPDQVQDLHEKVLAYKRRTPRS
jgi:hypothetical protein